MAPRPDSEFVHFVVESLQPLGPVTARRMFGGHGIFLHDLMFGLVAWDTLYFKVDAVNRPEFEHRGLEPFSYHARGRTMEMSYYEAPAEGLDDLELLCGWARDAYAAAQRARQARPTGRR
jgi:DNA transformation protein